MNIKETIDLLTNLITIFNLILGNKNLVNTWKSARKSVNYSKYQRKKMQTKPMIYKIELTCGDIIVLEAEDPLKAAIMASSDWIRAKKNHHIAVIEYKGERIEMYLNLVAL